MRKNSLSNTKWSILQSIRSNVQTSHEQIIRQTGFPEVTVTRLVNQMMEDGIILPSSLNTGDGKAGYFSVNAGAGFLVGIDVGSTRIKTAVLDFSLKPFDIAISPIPTGDTREAMIRNIGKSIDRVLSKIAPEKIVSIGFAFPGSVDHVRNTVITGPNLPRSSPVTLDEIITEEYRQLFKDVSIGFDHDAECCAIAEKEIGAEEYLPREFPDFACVAIGTGVCAGIVVSGNICRGQSNDAGEIGHIFVNEQSDIVCGCGKKGCLELEISGPSIARKWREKTGKQAASEVVAQSARQGNIQAIELFDDVGMWLGRGLSYTVNILNPGLIVLNGGVADSYDLFYPKMMESLDKYCWNHGRINLVTEKTRLGLNASAYGAAIGALYKGFEE